MSESAPTIQWISQYIIKVAETCGKSVADIETISHSQKKRVQILEFLTYNQDVAIWGKVSDEEYSIPVCFTKDAVSQYVQNFQGRLTKAKHAICLIGQFRPIFVRIPVGNHRVRWSEEPHIALEAGVVNYVDSGLGVLGSPQDIEMNIQVREWVRGLQMGGHGGPLAKNAWSNPLTPRDDCKGATLVSGKPQDNQLADEQKTPPYTVIVAGESQSCAPPLTRMPQRVVDGHISAASSGLVEGLQSSGAGGEELLTCRVLAAASEKENSRHQGWVPQSSSPHCPQKSAQCSRRPILHPPCIAAPPSSLAFPIHRSIEYNIPHPYAPLSPVDALGVTQVFVPDCETSSARSQHEPQSQPQSPSLSHLPNSQSPRYMFPSQLTPKFNPGQTSTHAARQQRVPCTGRGASLIHPGDELKICSGGDTDAHQVVKPLTSKALDAKDVETIGDADMFVALNITTSPASEDPSDRHSPINDTSSQSSDLSRLSFLRSPILSVSPSEVTSFAVPGATSPPLTDPTKPTRSHGVEGYMAPSFVNTEMDTGMAVEGLHRMSEMHTGRRASPTHSSPCASRKHRNRLMNHTTSAVPNGRRNHAAGLDIRESNKESTRINKSSSRKARMRRLMGYQVDFENICQGGSTSLFMTMEHLRTGLLQTGRIRTLGHKVTRDGSIYLISD